MRCNSVPFDCVFSGSSEVGSCITDSGGWENYMDDEDGGTIADKVTRFVSRFVDRVGTEAGISQEHLKSLYTMIPGEQAHSLILYSPRLFISEFLFVAVTLNPFSSNLPL